MRILTFDIGGAYTKKMVTDFDSGFPTIASSDIVYFPFWERKNDFRGFLMEIKEDADFTGITMTAELSDAFGNKTEGVRHIVSVCEEVFENPFYLSVNRALLRFNEITYFKELAASNWIASLYYLERRFGKGILVDVGSTTTDIIPFSKDRIPYCKSDLDRLRKSHLVYTGVLRTPVSSIVKKVPLKGELVRISPEHFAITADVYSILGTTADYTCETPDGRGKGRKESMERITRVLCSDLEDIGEDEVVNICKYIHKTQVGDIAEAMKVVSQKEGLQNAYICGIGKSLAREACENAGLKVMEVDEAGDNLPCLGLAYMVGEKVGEMQGFS